VQLGRGEVAEHRARTGAEHRRPEPGLAGRRPGEDRVHTSVKLLPALPLEAPGDQLST
jgi:hypothetical protein